MHTRRRTFDRRIDALRPARRRRGLRAALTLVSVLALFAVSQASGADISSRVTTSATVKAGSYNEWAPIRVDLKFSVASANTGDTFRMPLDKMLNASKFVPLALKDPGGATVATVAVAKTSSGAIARDRSGNAILEFTFTNYVATHSNITGSAFFELTFDHDRISFPGSSTQMTAVIYGTTVTITAQPGVVGTEQIKYGNWRSPNNSEGEATALNPDGSSANPGADIVWTVQLLGGTQGPALGWTRAAITETNQPGWHFECPLTPSPWAIRKDLTTSLDRWLNTSTPGIGVTACSRTAVTIVVTKQASDTNIYRIRFPGWIDGAPLPASYANTAQIRYEIPNAAAVSQTLSTRLDRVLQGGEAVGDSPQILPPGTPRLTITKRAIAKVAVTGGTLRWRIIVRNAGNVAATNVKVCDVLRDSQAFPGATVQYRVGTTLRRARLTISAGAGCLTIPRLGPRQRLVVIVTTHVPATARRRVRNTATATATGLDTIRAHARVPVVIVGVGTIPSPSG